MLKDALKVGMKGKEQNMEHSLTPLALHEIPEALIANVADTINNRTVALVRCRQYANGTQEALHIGSGILVSIGDTFGILTANHVVGPLEGLYHIGIDIGPTPHAFLIDKDHIQIIRVAEPETNQLGPDLAFIRLAHEDVSTIKASVMNFHSISRDIADHQENQLIGDTGVWFLSGVPEEKSEVEGPWADFNRVHVFEHYTLPGMIEKPFKRDEYDYAEMMIDYDIYERVPTSFAGMSGGGLWQVAMETLPSGVIRPFGIYLGGVIFYQSELVDGKRRIRCHFRESIHHNLVEAITERQGDFN